MKTYQIPNMREILKPRWSHKPGFGMSEQYVLKKRSSLEQSSTPEDSALLKKLGISKGDNILTIAGYYASWASKLVEAGAKVDYSDISRTMVNWARKEHGKLFGKYVASNYELIPRKVREYDWTFTYEACGGGSGLPIAYMRSLLNKKGGVLVLFIDKENPKRMGSKLEKYPRIVKALSKVYGADYDVKNMKIKGHRIDGPVIPLPFLVCTVRTNETARELAEKDLEALTSNHFNEDNLIRLSKFAKAIKMSGEFIRAVKTK